jgi:hypothetical protein
MTIVGILRQNAQTSLKGASAICHRSDGAVFTRPARRGAGGDRGESVRYAGKLRYHARNLSFFFKMPSPESVANE